MIKSTLAEIANYVQGTLTGPNIDVETVSTDTRTIVDGDLFVALKGPNYNAHDFVHEAAQQGAAALLISEAVATDLPFILVKDTHAALGLLAKYNRKALPRTKIVGITGSSGKTTVREMVASILREKGNVLATQGNLNNDIGVPLTLLQLNEQHDFAVIEMGANHQGEILYTTKIAQPQVALISNVTAAHLQGFGSLHGVARAKAEIFDGLNMEGVGLVNADSPFVELWRVRLSGKGILSFGLADEADIRALNIKLDGNGCPEFDLVYRGSQRRIKVPLPGRHNVMNAMAAAGAALALGFSLQEISNGLLNVAPVPGRLNIHQLAENIRVIDDTYNANSGSLQAAMELLSQYEGHKILVLGDMAELGDKARHYHEEAGKTAAELGIEQLYTVGVLSRCASDAFGTGAIHFSQQSQLVDALSKNLQAPVTVLVKGSRSARMENVVTALMNKHLDEVSR